MEAAPKRIVSSPDGSINLSILSTLQAPKWKADGQILVAVYCASFPDQDEEVVLKVILMADNEEGSPRARTETAALQRLTDCECRHAPRLLASWVRKPESALGLVEHCVVMTKVEGVSIPVALQMGCGTERVEKAFREAIGDVHGCGVDNGAHGHHQGNALYDPSEEKCYILDFDKGVLYDNPEQIDPSFRDIKTWFKDWHDGWDGRSIAGRDTNKDFRRKHVD